MCGMHSLWSSLKFLNSAKRFRWLTSIRDEEELWGVPVIKRLPLLMATHFNSHSSHPYPACQRFTYWKKEIKVAVFYSFFSVVFSIPTLFGIYPHFHFMSRWDGHVRVCVQCKWGFYSTTRIHTKGVETNSPSLLRTLYLKHKCPWADAESRIRPNANYS